MRVKTFYLLLKTISVVVLFFFMWTFGPMWQAVAYAATSQKSDVRGQKTDGSRTQPAQDSTAGKFEKALDAIRENIGKADEKTAKGQDITTEVAEVKKKRAEIESIDVELKKEFAVTEKKLKDAKLPKEVLDRHYKFVKHYEDNLAELKANLDGHEKAQKTQDKALAKEYLKKIKLHLEKTEPPRKHVPLDPNKLPNRMVKAKARMPRLRKEDFEKDFPPQKKANKLASLQAILATDSHGLTRILNSAWSLPSNAVIGGTLHSALANKPILVASNGSLAGLLSFDSQPESAALSFSEHSVANDLIPHSAFAISNLANPQSTIGNSQLMLAASTLDLPTADDLAETPEIQFTQDIQNLAAQLNHNPVQIYDWVRNNIEFVPTYGSIQGADMCLQTKQCNAFDTNALLSALLRTSNIPTRFVYGTIEIPIDKVMNWVGGFTDPASALNYVASGGIPVTGLRSGGQIYAARIETVWIRAFVDYIPSFGAVQRQSNTWVPLDASFKQYTYTDGVDFQAAVPFNGQGLADQLIATSTINTQESYVTNVSTTVIQSAQADYETQLNNYVAQNLPNATSDDILGKKAIIAKTQPILPASLPYKVVVAGTEASDIPDQLRHKITIQLADADNPGNPAITYTSNVAQLAGKRFTISYDPATAADQTTINNYVAQGATSIPAYLVQFKPVLKIEGATVATGAPIGMGHAQNLTVSIISPNGTQQIDHDLLAGDYTAIGINPSTISLDVLNNRINKNDFSEPVGEMLHQTALSYWAEADAFNGVIAQTLRVNNLRHPSELAASAKVSVSYVFGVPSSATYNRRNIDVKLDNQSLASKIADKKKEYSYMQQSGINSSFLEGAVLDQLFLRNIGDSISAVTAIKTANDQGTPIYRIDSSNIAAILPQLQVSDAIKTETSNAVNAGLAVQIPQTNITLNGWTGTGYIVSNPVDGSGAYRISGGLNGSDSGTGVQTVIPLPQIPATWSMAFLTNGLLTETGTGIQMAAGTTVMEGIAIGGGGAAGTAGAAGAAAALAEIAAIILIAVLIYAIAKAILDKMLPRYEMFRHYTTFAAKAGILRDRVLIGSLSGAIGPGAYVTKTVWLDPADPANVVQIQIKLGMPSDKIQTYIDLRVNVNKVIVTLGAPFGFPDQCALNMPTLPPSPIIPLDGDTATPMP